MSDDIGITVRQPESKAESRRLEMARPGTTDVTDGTVEWLWFFDEFPPVDVLVLCLNHLKKLRQVVEECEAKVNVLR